MRLNTMTRFPHPVLEQESQDYAGGEFTVDFQVSECKNTGNITIRHEALLNQPELAQLLEEERASVILFVECLRTYYNRRHNIQIGAGEVLFDKGELRDKVKLRPYLVANQAIEGFSSDSLHDEFGYQPWKFKRADVLAVAPEVTIDVGLEKLAPMESIFNLSISEEVPDGETRVNLEMPRITITASKKTCEGLNKLRSSSFGKLALLNGVYLPVLMQVLEALKVGGQNYEEYRWYGVFDATCTHLGIDASNADLLEDAQALFKSPLGKFLGAKEFIL